MRPLTGTLTVALMAALAAGTAEAKPSCAGKRAKFIGTGGDDVFRLEGRARQTVVSRGGDDLIIARSGKDRICTGKGDDRVVSGPQPDVVRTGRGDDVVYAGGGRDLVRGGPGEDLAFGEAGSDLLRGGRHADRLFGGIVDDVVRGAAGDDLLVGGHGGDGLVGGSGRDWLRGGTNQDGYWGGTGADTLSYATATPTNTPGGISGVSVDLAGGIAVGEGRRERIRNTEHVLGSPFDDKLTGNGRANVLEGGFGDDFLSGGDGEDSSSGGDGSDQCSGFERSDPSCNDNDPRPASAVAMVSRRDADPGLIVIGRPGEDDPDRLRVEAGAEAATISAATPIVAGPGCEPDDEGVRCPGAPRALNFIAMAGLGGDDALRVSGRTRRRGEVQLDGGSGDDRLRGTIGDDVLLGGPSGRDRLRGRRGHDALISEAGRDVLRGGRGSDQLVTDDPCFGHVFDGGGGSGDIAGFARAKRTLLRAKLGGRAVDRRLGRCRGTRVLANNEILEGTPRADVLFASDGGDVLLGAEGGDRLFGGAGDDRLEGEEGRDAYFSRRGRDLLRAKDGRRDKSLDCGKGSDYVKRDPFDPEPKRCRPPKQG